MLNDGDLTGEVVVVTGGTRGIGRAIVVGAVERGARVAFCAREIGPDAAAVQREAEQRGGIGRVLAVRADVAREADVEGLFAATLDAFGRVDVAINNAALNRDQMLVSLPTEAWDEVIAANLTGAFLVTRRAIQLFLASGTAGRIVSIGSIAQNGQPWTTNYAASKGGLQGLTSAIAQEYGAHGIRANLVVAGLVDTQLSRQLPDYARRAVLEACSQKREASAGEIAAVALFLASPRSAGLNGEEVLTTGGLLQIPV